MTGTKGLRHVVDACIVVVFAGAGAGFPLLQYLSYHSGRTDHALETGSPMLPVVVLVMACLLLLGSLALLVARLWRQRQKVPVWNTALRCAVVLVMCVTTVGVIALRKPGVYWFARGVEEKMRADADVSAIRVWARGLGGRVTGRAVPEGLWPECVRRLSPREVSVLRAIQGVEMAWGGGFAGHYGLVVGPEDTVLPDPAEHEFFVSLEDGAYLFFPRK